MPSSSSSSRLETGQHRSRVPRIDDDGVHALAQQPDVVVAEGADRDNRGHGCIVATARRFVKRARRLARHAARPLSAYARAGVVRPAPAWPTSSATTRSRSGCPSYALLAQAGLRAMERRLRRARAVAGRPALAAVRRERARPDRVAARPGIHSRAAPAAAGDPRAVRPEGQVLTRDSILSACSAPGVIFGREQFPPWNGNFIALYRLKDWLALLGFEVTGGGSGLLRAAILQSVLAHALCVLRVRRRSLVAMPGRLYLRATKG